MIRKKKCLKQVIIMLKNKIESLILAACCSSRFNLMNDTFKKYFLKLNNPNILGYIFLFKKEKNL